MNTAHFPMPKTVSRVNGRETKTGVVVCDRDGTMHAYPDAVRTHLDDFRNLYVSADEGRTLAVFADGEWLRVEARNA